MERSELESTFLAEVGAGVAVVVEALSWLLTLLLSEQRNELELTFLAEVGVAVVLMVVEALSWLLTLLLSELSSSGSLLPDRTPRTSGRPELCRILHRDPYTYISGQD
jgi:hypothetical protein